MEERKQSGMGLRFRDGQPLKGILKYTVFRNGVAVEDVEETNLIVTAGRTQLAHLLAGDVAERRIARIAFGTSGVPPALSDTEIANRYLKNISGFSFPEPGQITFNWGLGTAEANGKAILEFGLLCADNTLFSRRIRESGRPINKESDISLEGEWTIIF
jgi:hypothetical protein